MLERSRFSRYAVAVCAPFMSALAGTALHAAVGYRFPLISFYPTVMFSAWYGGFWPGIVTTVGSMAVVDRIWLAPLRATNEGTIGDSVALVIFLGIGIASSWFSESLHRVSARERAARERAEDRENALHEREHQLQLALGGERSARGEAEAANQLKDHFLAIVSHELRTPLNALVGWSEVLRTRSLTEGQRDRAIAGIHANARRQAQLVDDLIDVARMMSGKLNLERSSISIGDVIRGAVDIVQRSADAKHIDLSADVPAGLRPLNGDGIRLQQVIWNLVTNAVKFTPEHGIVSVRVREVDNELEIAVADTGRGIPPELRVAIFEPFRQVDGSNTRANAGLGLGLSIVKHLVDAHGGTITAESAGVRRGATFIVRLPLIVAASYAVVAEVAPVPSGPLGGIIVVVVDDDPENLDVVTANLELHGCAVVTAMSAADAFETIIRVKPQVLLIDIAMPSEDGYSLIRRIRSASSKEIAATPAAALTAFARREDRQLAIEAGFQEHIAKPVTSDALVGAVARLAARAHAF
jgi:signal transduction histidine kinase/CheY-like chemotaxis protein